MYAKFSKIGYVDLGRDIREIVMRGVWHHGELVVPRTSIIIEVDEIEFKKHRVLTREEFEEHMLALVECTILFWEDLEGGIPEEGLEYIVARWSRQGSRGMFVPTTTVVAMDACLFLMGESGQTIDKLCCERG